MIAPPHLQKDLDALRTTPHRSVPTAKVEAFIDSLCRSDYFSPFAEQMTIKKLENGVLISFVGAKPIFASVLIMFPSFRFFSPMYQFTVKTPHSSNFSECRERPMCSVEVIQEYAARWLQHANEC
jgi:hypothetical protein